MNSDSAEKPWLKNEQWAARTIICEMHVGTFMLIVSYFFFGMPGVAILAFGEHSFGELPIGIGFLTGASVITYYWLRGRRYGESVCRLLTLPGVIGGWFKADVECALPTDIPGPVTVELKNAEFFPGGPAKILWKTGQDFSLDQISAAGSGRSIVRVRLQIPRNPAQKALPLEYQTSYLSWRLIIKKAARGIDFYAEFWVPIYDVPDAPESEQQAE